MKTPVRVLAAAILVTGCASSGSKSAQAPVAPSVTPVEQPAAKVAPAPATESGSAAASGGSGPPPPQSPAASDKTSAASRRAVLGQAASEVDVSQRELDVAGGDCRNACRALASMDRAAGQMCVLAQSNDERGRCTAVKARVVTARDKVRSTCGSCPDVSVDRSAPIPSR